MIVEGSQRFSQFLGFDGSRMVPVEAFEDSLPFGDVLPQSGELYPNTALRSKNRSNSEN